MPLRALTAADAPLLSAFVCSRFKQPWSVVIEEMVQEHLAPALERGEVEAAGLFSDAGELVGVASWSLQWSSAGDAVVRSILIAVRNGQSRRGYGRELKQHVLQHASEVGASAVVSDVNWGNEAMLQLNRGFGASIVAIPGDRDYCTCVIPL